ncbi:MAG: hypothetical protein HOW73_29145 [Polyangiaceae bacterium]|nr:hypothetical protein [Polyangiaceae bacterium]
MFFRGRPAAAGKHLRWLVQEARALYALASRPTGLFDLLRAVRPGARLREAARELHASSRRFDTRHDTTTGKHVPFDIW